MGVAGGGRIGRREGGRHEKDFGGSDGPGKKAKCFYFRYDDIRIGLKNPQPQAIIFFGLSPIEKKQIRGWNLVCT